MQPPDHGGHPGAARTADGLQGFGQGWVVGVDQVGQQVRAPTGVAGVVMTLTAPGCPVAHTLPVEVANKVKSVDGVTDAKVDITWEPAWTKDRMSDAAKLQLGMW